MEYESIIANITLYKKMHKQEMSMSENIDLDSSHLRVEEDNFEAVYDSLTIEEKLDHPDWRVVSLNLGPREDVR